MYKFHAMYSKVFLPWLWTDVYCLNDSGTKQAAHRLKILFGLAGFKAAELHGNLTQAQRLDVSIQLAYSPKWSI